MPIFFAVIDAAIDADVFSALLRHTPPPRCSLTLSSISDIA